MDQRATVPFRDGAGTIRHAHAYNPESVPASAVRLADPTGSPAAFNLQAPGGPGASPWRVQTTDGVRTVAADWEVLEDFETGGWPGAWSGTTGQFARTSGNPIEGTYSLRSTTTSYPKIANASLATPRGYEYRIRVRMDRLQAVGLFVGVQFPDFPHDENYWAMLNEWSPGLRLYRRRNQNSALLTSSSWTPNQGVTYDLAIEFASFGQRAKVYTPTGTLITQTAWSFDTTHSGGCLGLYSGGQTGNHYDVAVRYPL